MKRSLILPLLAILISAYAIYSGHSVARAQVANSPYSYSVGPATHTSCPAVVATLTMYCFPADGPYVSINGAAWQPIPLTSGVAGVTSFNGRTGAVLPVPSDYPDAVTSVNGKTGAVVLSATTTVQ